ncbi:MAG TPA: response regulator transcription factor [Thermoleophilaceae bacterium]|nr:response regulator transcription factor [Thermoleophilaceae bacterium]
MPTTVLVAERDEALREFLVGQFLADRFAARGAQCAEEARVKLASLHPHLLVLGEFEHPHAPLELLRGIRSGGDEALQVIVLSSDSSELAELRAFREGCDDYLPKPISYPVLLARLRALLRRSRGATPARQRVGALQIDALQRRVTVAKRSVQVSRVEFELLSHLATEPTRVYTKEELLRDVWGFKALGNTRTVDAHASRLRKKLALAGAPNLIGNVRGVGYRLCAGPVVTPPEAIAAPLSAAGRAA